MYSPKGFNGKLLKYFNIFFQMRIYTFFCNSDRDFQSENKNVS
jgi:hypothetical protein